MAKSHRRSASLNGYYGNPWHIHREWSQTLGKRSMNERSTTCPLGVASRSLSAGRASQPILYMLLLCEIQSYRAACSSHLICIHGSHGYRADVSLKCKRVYLYACTSYFSCVFRRNKTWKVRFMGPNSHYRLLSSALGNTRIADESHSTNFQISIKRIQHNNNIFAGEIIFDVGVAGGNIVWAVIAMCVTDINVTRHYILCVVPHL